MNQWFSCFILTFFLAQGFVPLHAASVVPSPLAVSSEASPILRQRPIRLPPLLWYENDPEDSHRLFMLGLLYWNLRDHETKQWMFFPFAYHWQEPDHRLLVTLPLFAAYASKDEKWSLAGPWYRYRGSEGERSLLFPLWWQSQYSNGERTRAVPPLLYYERRTPETARGLFLNTLWSYRKDSGWHSFFPLYTSWWSPGDRLRLLIPFYDRRLTSPAVAVPERHV